MGLGASSSRTGVLVKVGSGPDNAMLDDITSTQFRNMPASGIFISLRNQANDKNIIWNIPKSRLSVSGGNLLFSGYVSPQYKNADIDSSMKIFSVYTENPIISTPGEQRYLSTTDVPMTGFYILDEISYNPTLKQLKWTLKSPKNAGGGLIRSSFPSVGRVFDKIVIKHGSERRLSLGIDALTITLREDGGASTGNVYADYTYNLTSQDTLIKDDDADNNFNIEFEKETTTGEESWNANILRGGDVLSPTVDFKIEEEGLRTYVRLNGQYPFNANDELIFSHIIPQELIDAGSGGTPEDQSVEAQITALQATLAALQRSVATNTGDISTLENASAAGDVSFFHGILGLPGGRASGPRANARDIAHLSPLVSAEMSNPLERTVKTISSLTLGGGLVQFNASSQAGYYVPWIAIETADIGTKTLNVVGPGGFESDLWSSAGSVTVDNKNYSLYARIQPLINGKSLTAIFKLYE